MSFGAHSFYLITLHNKKKGLAQPVKKMDLGKHPKQTISNICDQTLNAPLPHFAGASINEALGKGETEVIGPPLLWRL